MATNLSCNNCGRKISHNTFERLIASDIIDCTCGYGLDLEDNSVKANLAKSAEHLSGNIDVIRDSLWFHLTKSDEFDPNRDEMHVGTLETVRAYRSILGANKPYGVKFKLWVMRVMPGVAVKEELLDDDNRWRPVLDDLQKNYSGGIARYINKWEGPGQVSLVGPSCNFQVVGELSPKHIPRTIDNLSV